MANPALVALRDDLLAKLDGLSELRTKAMFGCYGVYAEGDVFFAIVDAGCVYFRTDATTRPAYDAAGSTGFRGSDNYRSVPAEVLADPATLLRWAEESVDASRRVKKK